MKLTDYEIVRDGAFAKCPICQIDFKWRGLPSHLHRAHNPEYINSTTKGQTSWNKGLTKNSDKRVALIAEKTSIIMSGSRRIPPQ